MGGDGQNKDQGRGPPRSEEERKHARQVNAARAAEGLASTVAVAQDGPYFLRFLLPQNGIKRSNAWAPRPQPWLSALLWGPWRSGARRNRAENPELREGCPLMSRRSLQETLLMA